MNDGSGRGAAASIVIGAGPAGLAVAYTLARAGRPVVVIEREDVAGGLASSFDHEGFIFDYGPHVFTPDRKGAQELWDEVLGNEQVLLRRKTRMYWRGYFFDYPPRVGDFVRRLGLKEAAGIASSLVGARLKRRPAPGNLTERMEGRFGPRLFSTCFKDYIEKLFGVPCDRLRPDWQPGRLRNTTLAAMVYSYVFGRNDGLIPYPRRGCRQFYQGVAERVRGMGQTVLFGHEVVALEHDGSRVERVVARPRGGGEWLSFACGEGRVFSSMPLGVLLRCLSPPARELPGPAAHPLPFRNTLLVYLIVDGAGLFADHCLYINDRGFRVGRIANFANWSPDLSPDPSRTALCCEYWYDDGDEVATASDPAMMELAGDELERLGLLRCAPVVGGCVRRLRHTHPIPAITTLRQEFRADLARFENLEPIGRAGSFSYLDQDDSIVAGIRAAEASLSTRGHLPRPGAGPNCRGGASSVLRSRCWRRGRGAWS
jgi:protoporphyrinogen oxidase